MLYIKQFSIEYLVFKLFKVELKSVIWLSIIPVLKAIFFLLIWVILYIISFLDESSENIRKHLKLKRFPISKYLNTVYQYYCNKGDIEYKPLTKSKIIKLDEDIIRILDF